EQWTENPCVGGSNPPLPIFPCSLLHECCMKVPYGSRLLAFRKYAQKINCKNSFIRIQQNRPARANKRADMSIWHLAACPAA
ncbi:MAG TPA: hypothetical protein VLH60_06310, partial [Sedimentisphaerales bacterium]|nr:hypothetical protein [Sedimentisphaerales bacterium]